MNSLHGLDIIGGAAAQLSGAFSLFLRQNQDQDKEPQDWWEMQPNPGYIFAQFQAHFQADDWGNVIAIAQFLVGIKRSQQALLAAVPSKQDYRT